MYPYSSRQMTTWERLLAMADPLYTQMADLFICRVALVLDASCRLRERCALYLMQSASIDCRSRLPPEWDVCPAGTGSTARCCLCALHWLRLWVKYKITNTFLWRCLAFSDPWLCNLLNRLSFWPSHATETVNPCFQCGLVSEKGKKEQRFTLTRLPTEGWISRRSWQPR